jgi:hypothetical protein
MMSRDFSPGQGQTGGKSCREESHLHIHSKQYRSLAAFLWKAVVVVELPGSGCSIGKAGKRREYKS